MGSAAGNDDLATRDEAAWGAVQRVLEHVREHLGMEIAHLSRFVDGRQVILAASGDTTVMNFAVGDRIPLEKTFCLRVATGEVPPAVPDARRDPVARDLPVTWDAGIGSYVGEPLRDDDGAVVGMLCCLSRGPNPMLDEQALRVLRLAVALVDDHLPGLAAVPPDETSVRSDHIRAVLGAGAVRMVLQPVVELDGRATVGLEALARFDDPVFAGPAEAFAAADLAGVGVDLELLALRRALDLAPRVPAPAWVSVNLSSATLVDPRAAELLGARAASTLVVELTEHTQVVDYPRLRAVTDALKAEGVRLAVDDAGAGYASLRHILRLAPDVIKLDIDIIRGVDTDLVRQALTRSMVQFADGIGADLVAEGVETEAECGMLRELGVRLGQGYLFGRPAPLAA